MHRTSCSRCSGTSVSLAELHLESLVHNRRDSKILDIQSLALRQHPLILQQEASQGDLDLVDSKEPSRTGVFLLPESKMVLPGSDELSRVLFSEDFSLAEEAPAGTAFLPGHW